jgi:hypothetical protein
MRDAQCRVRIRYATGTCFEYRIDPRELPDYRLEARLVGATLTVDTHDDLRLAG